MANEPSQSTIPSKLTADRFAGHSKFTRELCADRPVVNLFTIPSVTVASLAGVGAGAPITQELDTTGLISIFMDNDADAFPFLWNLPSDMDVTKPIDFSVLWTQSQGAATGSCLWSVLYTSVVMGTTSLTAEATTALDVIIANQADLAADVPQWTAWGTIDAGKTGVSTLEAGTDALLVNTVSTTHTTITDVDLLAVRARYYRRFIG